jgi:hypothetical protein
MTCRNGNVAPQGQVRILGESVMRISLIAQLGVVIVLLAAAAQFSRADKGPIAQGVSVRVGKLDCTLTKVDALPYVESDYSRRFKFDAADNPKLTELRERYHLAEVVAPGKDEFDRQVLLLDWVNHHFKKFGRPTSEAKGALDILAANDAGNTFFCAHYAQTFVSAAASLGWVDRSLALRRPDAPGNKSTEHTSTEIWSNQYAKWIMLDPTFAMYVEKNGIPLSAFELRQEWFYHDGRDLTFVLDKDRKRFKKSDLPVFRNRFLGFGDLVLDAGALDVYAFIGYVPNTNLMNAGLDYGGMFIVQDKLCDGTKWHKRTVPADPAHDPYFPIGQAAPTIVADGLTLHVSLKTLTPNFKSYLARFDGGEWKPIADNFTWTPHAGANRLELKTINQSAVQGPISVLQIDAKAP